jgi:peptidoglycan-N-acetylglucosamine deacetylase
MMWHMRSKEKKLFLTFDDGPIPEVTPWVLDLLKKYNAKATFFCIGDNVQKHPKIYRRLLSDGHRTGNHTMHHVNGWKAKNHDYFRQVIDCSALVKSDLFRPPYGRIRLSQANSISKKYRIVMWDVLSRDYDRQLNGEQVLKNVLNSSRPGSIVVFHDSLKALDRLKIALPSTLEYFSSLGYSFEAIR